MNERSATTDLTWRRDGAGWVLLNKRRRMGRVVPAHSGMWQSTRSDGQPSDIANLSWAKNAVLVAAERELEFEHRSWPANDPQNARKSRGFLMAQPRPCVFRPTVDSDDRLARQVAAYIGDPYADALH